jgi:hypothetical protein
VTGPQASFLLWIHDLIESGAIELPCLEALDVSPLVERVAQSHGHLGVLVSPCLDVVEGGDEEQSLEMPLGLLGRAPGVEHVLVHSCSNDLGEFRDVLARLPLRPRTIPIDVEKHEAIAPQEPGRDGAKQLGQDLLVARVGALPAGAPDGLLRVLVPGLEVQPVRLVTGHGQAEHPLHDLGDRRVRVVPLVLGEHEQRAEA